MAEARACAVKLYQKTYLIVKHYRNFIESFQSAKNARPCFRAGPVRAFFEVVRENSQLTINDIKEAGENLFAGLKNLIMSFYTGSFKIRAAAGIFEASGAERTERLLFFGFYADICNPAVSDGLLVA